jgi:hypothetical protein
MTEHVSDLKWDRLLAGELAADQADAAHTHAATCASCGTRLRELTAERDAFRVQPQVVAFRRPRRAVWIGAATAVAAAAIAIFVLRPQPDPGERTKGAGPDLVLAAGSATPVPVSSGDIVFTGDALQAAYSSKVDGFGAVLARDGASGVFAYVPSNGDQMVALPAGENRLFPESTRLDNVIGRERVFVLWCEKTHAIAPLVAELRTTGEVAAPVGCFVRRVELTKQGRQ